MLEIIKKRLVFYLNAFFYVINLCLAFLVFKIYYNGKPKRNLITMGSSNGKYCGDNVYSLFGYLVKQNMNVVYIIDKHSKDREKAEHLGIVLHRFSFKANLMVLRSEIIIYDTSYVDLIRCKRKHLNHIKTINIFHGIHGLKKISKENAKKRVENDDYIIATSDHEKEIKRDWGFSTDRIFLTGLPRYDTLVSKNTRIETENKIFYMPTWRPWFNKGYMGPSKEDVSYFKTSNYFRNILQIATSQELNNLLKENNYVLEIYVHKLMHRYIKRMEINNKMSNIKFLNEETNIQNKIVESEILVTDYSSVFFDFLYLEKPVILYQFDKEKFYELTPGSYITEKEIKEIAIDELDQFIKAIRNKIKINYSIGIKTKELLQKYIKFNDLNNCNRIYTRIEELLKKSN